MQLSNQTITGQLLQYNLLDSPNWMSE